MGVLQVTDNKHDRPPQNFPTNLLDNWKPGADASFQLAGSVGSLVLGEMEMAREQEPGQAHYVAEMDLSTG